MARAAPSVVRAPAPPRRTRHPIAKGTSIATYTARRDFAVTSEPAAHAHASDKGAGIFVVQKHAASQLHWDFRLEHGGVLWSWAVPRGPSMDPADKRLAVHVEDHPIEYAAFQGIIPAGQYGAGSVETWDHGTWNPIGDAAEGIEQGELKFILQGRRLNGGFVLVRLKARKQERAENWLLIKEHDQYEREGGDAGWLEKEIAAPTPKRHSVGKGAPTGKKARDTNSPAGNTPPVRDAIEGPFPADQKPQLATLVDGPPANENRIHEVKFDGYRFLAFVRDGTCRMVTRGGQDWTARAPTIAHAIEGLGLDSAIIDGELVALHDDGVSSFAALQAALSDGDDQKLFFYAFDLLYLNGWDLRPCRLLDRKASLRELSDWRGALRYSDHSEGDAARTRRLACSMGVEGVISKQADAPYRAGRGRSWLKLKCQGREEFIVVGWTKPAGSRAGLGALHVGFHDDRGNLHYAGGVGTGFSDTDLTDLRARLDQLKAERPGELLVSGDPLDRGIAWVRPDMIVEVRYLGWTGTGRLRHAVYLGRREDKTAAEVIRDVPEPAVERHRLFEPARGASIVHTKPAVKRASPPTPKVAAEPGPGKIVHARAPARGAAAEMMDGVRLSHSDRELWPGISKHDLAAYWEAVADHALPEIAGRPLALLRCPEGIDGEHFFQKHATPGFPSRIRGGEADGKPYLVIDDLSGLIAACQVSAIELHVWGASGADMTHPDRLVFDLDPGEGVAMPAIASAARLVRDRLADAGLAAFCRTTGGKGLHVVAPIRPDADWEPARAWCRAFAERLARDMPDRFVATIAKARRRGRILLDWLRNDIGSTAVASFSPRARPGAGVATRLAWREVTDTLDPGDFTLRTVPARLARQKTDPWAGFAAAAAALPDDGGRR
jgi:bifunctional non-homologous end joining protein LigD